MEDKKKLLLVGAIVVIAAVAVFFSFRQSGLGGERPQVIGTLEEMERASGEAAGGTVERDPSMP